MSPELRLDPLQAATHAQRLSRLLDVRKQVSHILEKNEGEDRVDYIHEQREDGTTVTYEVFVSADLHRKVANALLEERILLVDSGFPALAEEIAPSNPTPKEPTLIFAPGMLDEAA